MDSGHGTDAGAGPPGHATASPPGITDLFTTAHRDGWTVEAGYENTRTVTPALTKDGSADITPVELHDVVVRVHRS